MTPDEMRRLQAIEMHEWGGESQPPVYPTKWGRARGGASGRKLTAQHVKEIRATLQTSYVTYNELAEKYNVSHHTIFNVANRRTWKNIP